MRSCGGGIDELFANPSQVKILWYAFQLYEKGKRVFARRDLEKEGLKLSEWTLKVSLKRLRERRFLIYVIYERWKGIMYALNMENEIVEALYGVYRAIRKREEKEKVENDGDVLAVVVMENGRDGRDGRDSRRQMEIDDVIEECVECVESGDEFDYERFWMLMEASESE